MRQGLCLRAGFLLLLTVVAPWGSEQMKDTPNIPKATPLVRGEVLDHRQDCWILATPMSHLPGTVGRFGRKLGTCPYISKDFAQVCVSLFSEHRLCSRLWKLWEMSPFLPRAAHSPAGTQMRELGVMEAWADAGGMQEVTPFIHQQ